MPNTYSQIYLHYVFSPKYREALIKAEFEEELFRYITGVIKNLDQHLIRINGMPDHCHFGTFKTFFGPIKIHSEY